MRESDSLDAHLREWKLSDPSAELDRRVIAAYRSAIPAERVPSRAWRRFRWRKFWTTRVSIPAPALAAAALAILALFLWLRRPAAAVPPQETQGVVTRLNVSGFQPLPNGDARVIPAKEVQR